MAHRAVGRRLAVAAVILLVAGGCQGTPSSERAREAHAARERSFVLTMKQAAQNVLDKAQRTGPEAGTRRASAPEPFTYRKMQVSGYIENRMANTTVSMSAEPASEAREAEVVFEIPDGAFVDSLRIVIGSVLMQATVKEAEVAQVEYQEAKEQGKTAALAESRGTTSFALKISIGAGDRTEVAVGYQQYLTSRRGQYEYVLALKPRANRQASPDVSIDLTVRDADGLESVNIQEPEMRCAFSDTSAVNMQCGMDRYAGDAQKRLDAASIRFSSLNTAVVSLRPTHANYANKNDPGWDSIWGVKGDGSMSIDLLVSITPRAAEGGTAYPGTLMLDDEGYFTHVYRNPALKSMPKTVVLVIDTSGSMEAKPCAECKTRMEQAQVAAKHILKELKPEDEFALVGFDDGADTIFVNRRGSSSGDMVLQSATPELVEEAMRFVGELYPSGASMYGARVCDFQVSG